MSKNSGSNEKDKRIRDVLEETFARYEPKETTPSIPNLREEASRSPSREAQPERLMTVKVTEPPSPKNVNTGIAGLDNILNGGIADRSLIIVSGETGSHYNTFIQQILFNHVIENGKAVYYLAETLSMDIRQEMSQFSWNLQDFLVKGSWAFANLRTQDLHQLAELAPEILSDGITVKMAQGLNALKTDLLMKIKEGRWTVLELGHLLLQYDLKEVMELMMYWRAAIRVYGGLHFAILPSGILPETHINALQHLADGVLEFRLKEGHHDFEMVMAVRKLKHLLKPLMLTFTTEENGINIETAARIT